MSMSDSPSQRTPSRDTSPRQSDAAVYAQELRHRGRSMSSRDALDTDGGARNMRKTARAPSILQRVIATAHDPASPKTSVPNMAAFHAHAEDERAAVWHDADYCLYFDLVDQGSDPVAHAVVDATATVLRDIGCQVRVFPLEQSDSEVLATSREDTRAYIMTICSAFMATSPSKSSAKTNQAAQTYLARYPNAAWACALPLQLIQHPAFRLVVSLGSGAARSQQLARLIIKEYRLPRDVYLPDGTLVFSANQRLIQELMRYDGALRIQVFPLHRDSERDRLIASWKQQFALQLPLSEVFQYFGPKLAMYFTWLEFYTQMLMVPAAVGLLCFVMGHFNAVSYCILSFAISIGTSVFADLWRRRQRVVEYTWKYQQLMETDAVLDLETRTQFKGEWMTDAVTGQRVYDFPHDKRFQRQLLVVPLILGMCLLVGAYVIALNALSEFLRATYPVCFLKNQSVEALETQGLSAATCVTIAQGPGVLNAVIIQALDSLYQQLARRLNEYENYRTIAEFEEHLVLKRMPFHFVNSNASLWFLAFYVRSLERVRDRLWILMVLMQLLDNFKEVGLPFVVSMTAKFFTSDGKRRRSTTVDDTPFFSLAGGSSRLKTVPQRLQRVLTQKLQAHYVDTFADYKELMIQFGYVALYTPVFPLAPFFAWFNNVVESRSDFLKLVNSNGFQRPLVQHTHGIGVWERVLVSFSVVAVIINCAFVWIYEMKQLLPLWSDLHRFMLLMVFEHLVFVIKGLLNWTSPDLPSWIQHEKRIASLSSTHAQLLSPRRKPSHPQHGHW